MMMPLVQRKSPSSSPSSSSFLRLFFLLLTCISFAPFAKAMRRRAPLCATPSARLSTTTPPSATTQAASASSEVVQDCSSRSILSTLARGAALRIGSDLTLGTPLESIKTRVTVTTENMWQACTQMAQSGGLGAFYRGTPVRTIEGAVIGALFLAGSVSTKQVLKAVYPGTHPTLTACLAGTVGGVCQALAMTPAGFVFTAVHSSSSSSNKKKNSGGAFTTLKDVIQERGVAGLYSGSGPMVLRQATNWSSRAGLTEIARQQLLKSSSYTGMSAEILAGVLGGVGSCWNTPVETIRVVTQRNVAAGKPAQPLIKQGRAIYDETGVPGLFRGVTPRAIQAVWQTLFMVVVPNVMGL